MKPWSRTAYAVVPGLVLGIAAGALAATLSLVDYLSVRQTRGIVTPRDVFSLPTVTSYGQFLDLRARLRHLAIGGFKRNRTDVRDPAGSGPLVAVLECGSSNYFEVLGTRAERGRTWTSQDTNPVAVVTESFRRRLSRGRDVIGANLDIGGTAFTIIGVVGGGFVGLRPDPAEVFVPLQAAPGVCLHRGRDLLNSGNWLWSFGRLLSNSTVASARVELAANAVEGNEPLVPMPIARSRANAGLVRAAQLGLVAAVSLFLLAFCNVIGLQTLQALDRRPEIEIRRQLGASTWRLIWSTLRAQVPVCLAGLASSIVAAALLALLLADVAAFEIGDAIWHLRTMTVLALTVLLATFSAGGLLAVRAVRPRPRPRRGGGRGLIAVQVALAVFLIATAGVMVRSVGAVLGDAGLDIESLALVIGDPLQSGYRSDEDVNEMLRTLHRSLLVLPGVQSATISSSDLLWATQSGDTAYLRNSIAPAAVPAVAILNGVTASYAQTVGIVIREGRWLGPNDETGDGGIVIDENLARFLWPEGSPVGRCAYLLRETRCLSVVGIAGSRRSQVLFDSRMEVFMPLPLASRLRSDVQGRVLILRAENVAALMSSIQGVTGEVTKRLGFPAMTAVRVGALADSQTRSIRQTARLMGTFGAVGLVLGASGIFSTLAFVVRRKRPEIGLRMALGATPRMITIDVLRPLTTALAVGVGFGWLLVSLGHGLIQSVAFGVQPMDMRALAVSGIALVAAGFGGAVWPILAARRVSPAVALRD